MKSATDPAIQALIEGNHGAPLEILGLHQVGDKWRIRTFQPFAKQVELLDPVPREMPQVDKHGLFEITLDQKPDTVRFRIQGLEGSDWIIHDPYSFPLRVTDYDRYLFSEGTHIHTFEKLGAHLHAVDDVAGVYFAVWAPNAVRVSVTGTFNRWDGRQNPMQRLGESGIWELFIPGLQQGDLYKYEVKSPDGTLHEKSDPYAFASELRPRTASMVWDTSQYEWSDTAWMEDRRNLEPQHTPISVYEVHLGSWRRGDDDEFLTYQELAEQLIPYVQWLGFTHVELLPISEHPLDASWGYQTSGYYAPTSRFGNPDDFKAFIDACHQAGIGVIIDWVPAHYPKDPHGLGRFDGTALYEHEDPRQGEHRDWGTLIFNYGRNEVRSFLLSNAMYWAEIFHVDGFRVDAVASMLYLNYSREDGEWIPNEFGGNENLEAVDFLRKFNEIIHAHYPGILTFAEESTSWPMVSRPTYLGGLGFGLKWNMGWMNDSLEYFQKDPVHRKFHHHNLTFSLLYAFTENFILPYSHDEVVHGKGSLINKMPGDDWQKFANLRLLYVYMFTHPGKKLLFMGCEFGQWDEWNFDQSLDWHLAGFERHHQLQLIVRDLNHLYREHPELHEQDFDWTGFEWIDCNDTEQSILSYLRKDHAGRTIVVAFNLTPIPRPGYRLGVTHGGDWQVLLNSDSGFYGGSNTGSGGSIAAEEQTWQGRPHSLQMDLPPLAGVILKG